MNHLPQKDAGHIPVPFHFAERIIFAPGDFFRLPGLQGYSSAELVQKGPCLLDPSERSPFLQKWLFFALIAQVLNRKIDTDLFCHLDDNGAKVVDTKNIYQLFKECASPSSSLNGGHDWYHRRRAIQALDGARRFVLAWCSDKYVYLSTQLMPDPEGLVSSRDAGSNLEFRVNHQRLCLSFGIMGEALDRFCARQIEWSLQGNGPTPYGDWEEHFTDERSWVSATS